jgi:hypothetical protein
LLFETVVIIWKWTFLKTISLDRTGYIARRLANPFAAYAAGFLLAIGVYSLGFSDLYPPLQPSLLLFLLTTCAICAVIAFAIGSFSSGHEAAPESFSHNNTIFIVLMVLFGAECIYSGHIPLLSVVTGGDSDYRNFGIPTLNVALTGFCLFYAVYWFDLYMIGNGRAFLVFALIAASTSILIVHRGGFILTLVACVFVYIRRRGIDRKLAVSFVTLVLAALWGFGALGDLRTHDVSGESLILNIGEASDKFRDSNIPTEFFWPYLYISSPLSNLELNVTDRMTPDRPATYLILDLLPDFVSKRFESQDEIDAAKELLVTERLNVSTMYGQAFFLLGWLGLFLSFAYFVLISLASLLILRRSKYFIAASGILSSLAFLNIFDNMFIFAGGITQIFAAVVLHLFERPNRRSQHGTVGATHRKQSDLLR